MNYYTITPPAILAEYIQFFWVLEGTATTEMPYIHRIMAESSPEWIFYCKGRFELHGTSPGQQTISPSVISGSVQNFKIVYTSTDFCLFGVCLFPYAIPPIFGVASHTLTDQSADTTTLLGHEGKMLEQSVFEVHSHSQRATLISQYILKRLSNTRDENRAVFYSIKQMLFSPSALPISAIAESSFLSRRQFERKFYHYTGNSPKQFQRIARFNMVIKGFDRQAKSLSNIAHDCGYYDQSHFIHDFRLFSGYNPKNFFKHQKDATDYRAFEEFSLKGE